jgi:Cu+-exporting ATPase
MERYAEEKLVCFHCGEDCRDKKLIYQDHIFCCDGCLMVYSILNEKGLCDYYSLNQKPGINRRFTIRKDKFSFLDDEKTAARLSSFSDKKETRVVFHLPQIHCSSCLYLLENLFKLNSGISFSKVNFPRKEITISFDHHSISLRKVAELLTSVGYEPYISLNDLSAKKPKVRKQLIFQLGVAGFCFANIMLLSFPEYLGLANPELGLRSVFRTLNLTLALPVFFYSAKPFFSSAWMGLKQKFLNIDAPISLAILITFIRSAYEVISGSGAGYFDSMSGIVFLMLVGRFMQDRTYLQLSFDRDYSSYFPIAVTVIRDGKETAVPLPQIKPGDTLVIHHEEIIPTDGILTRGKGMIDYSFVTGESIPVLREMGEMIYAGGKQTGSNVEILVMHEVSQSNLTRLWGAESLTKGNMKVDASFIHVLSRYFTLIVFLIAGIAAGYWSFADPSRVWNAVTAVLIVACPCALLLSSSFTNGNILRLLARNGFYLKNAQVIERMANLDHLVFDKTGTLTKRFEKDILYQGKHLQFKERQAIASLAAQSTHPLSQSLMEYLDIQPLMEVTGFREIPGLGIEGFVEGNLVALGSGNFIAGKQLHGNKLSAVHVSWEDNPLGAFVFRNRYREHLGTMIRWLRKRFRLSVLSGDTESEAANLRKWFGPEAILRFSQNPEHKLAFIRHARQEGDQVAMIGDGLNDAVALAASDVGIAVSEDCNNFTPASDAILESSALSRLPSFIMLCRANKRIIMASFLLSIIYNIIGVYFAVQGTLSPMIAAILMPMSSICILLVTIGIGNLVGRWVGVQ